MIGEGATHGDGHTQAFKVALVELLIDQCGFDGVFFEASQYEFIELNRRLRTNQPVTASEVSSAVGGLWKFNQEFMPLPPFLLAKARSGQVFLGGIDDQLGQLGQDYANVEMVAELTDLLSPEDRQGCSLALHKRIFSDYPDTSPYSQSDRALIETCLSKMDRANAAAKITDRTGKAERQEMISAAQRWISRDFSSEAEYMVNRDRSMFQNFEWLLRQRPKRHKVIVWAATVHIAKQADPTWGDHNGTNFGSFVHQKYGSRMFALGFSALTGSYRQPGAGIQEITAGPPDCLEARALQGNRSDSAYIGSAQLSAMGSASGAVFRHSWQALPWSTFLDGVVVFQKEHPPNRTGEK